MAFSPLSCSAGVVLPYAAFAVFVAGFIYRIVTWAKSPVPFRITTTCGQQNSLPWIKSNPLESPSDLWGVIGRMALEIFLFRSLFRNTEVEIAEQQARLRQRQMALVFRPSLSLVASDHRAPAPAFLHRADRPLDQRPLGRRRVLRDRHPDPLSERCRRSSRG